MRMMQGSPDSSFPCHPKPSSMKFPVPRLTHPERLSLVIGSALVSFLDPERADMVALLGELTASERTLTRLRDQMAGTPEGAQLLRDRPQVRGESFQATALTQRYPPGTFGAAYGAYLAAHAFSPEERTPVRWVADPELAYVMTRYREVHDYLHVLSGLPPTVLGEVALKWLEMAQTGLPVAGLSALVGPLRLTSGERRELFTVLAPWAIKASRGVTTPLIAVAYEGLFHLPVQEARDRVGLIPAPLPHELR